MSSTLYSIIHKFYPTIRPNPAIIHTHDTQQLGWILGSTERYQQWPPIIQNGSAESRHYSVTHRTKRFGRALSYLASHRHAMLSLGISTYPSYTMAQLDPAMMSHTLYHTARLKAISKHHSSFRTAWPSPDIVCYSLYTMARPDLLIIPVASYSIDRPCILIFIHRLYPTVYIHELSATDTHNTGRLVRVLTLFATTIIGQPLSFLPSTRSPRLG